MQSPSCEQVYHYCEQGHTKKHHAHVLVLETEEFAHHALEFLLANAGFTVEFISSWKEVISSEFPGQAECLLVNCKLLAVNELSVWKLAEANSRLPIIFYSFKDNLLTQVSALKYRSLANMSPPIDSGTLLTAVEQVVLAQLDCDAREDQRRQLEQRIGKLTDSEQAVLELLAEGLPLEEIAQRRGTSCHTVRNQRSSILDKLEARTTADAARIYIYATNRITPRSDQPVCHACLKEHDSGRPLPGEPESGRNLPLGSG